MSPRQRNPNFQVFQQTVRSILRGPRCNARAHTQQERSLVYDPLALELADLGRVESAALDLLPSGIGIFDNDFNLVYANRAFRELRFLPERLCAPGTRLEDTSATLPPAATMAPVMSTSW